MRKGLQVGIGAVLAAGALTALATVQVLQGHGRLHEMARVAYRKYRDTGLQPARVAAQERADNPILIFEDTLTAGWQDWSWAEHRVVPAPEGADGRHALMLVPEGYKGLYLHHELLSTTGYGTLEFYVRGTARVNVKVADGDGQFGPPAPLFNYVAADPRPTGAWRAVRIPLAALGLRRSGSAISGIVFQAAAEAREPSLYLDHITLQPDLSLPSAPTEATVTVRVDAAADRHAISPSIYGMAFAPGDYLRDLRLGLNRWGGNDKSRYNWAHGNAVNAARDWRWANRPAIDGPVPTRPSSAADAFTAANRAAGAETLLTIPTIGWVARDSDQRHTSRNVPGHGGSALPGTDGAIAGYDPAENRLRTSVRSRPRKGVPFSDAPIATAGGIFQDEWVHHLLRQFGSAGSGGVRFYAMDNEPDLWDQTHTDIHPARLGYDDTLGEFLEYASAVKDVDPTAQVTGPVCSGWTSYEYSALDRGNDNFRTHAERKRHADAPFLPWFLKQVRAHDEKVGRRSLDVLDVHYYPQGTGLYGGATDQGSRALRLRSTRSLWDPTYIDESWIGQPVRLIPRLKEWIAAGYPGTRLGITEWNFGADQDINGALAIADVLGIFGREDVYLANYWAYPAKGSPGYLAFKLYRNADGQGTGFGDESCRATTSDERVACYAATDTRSGALTVMLVNKFSRATVTAPVTLTGWTGRGGAIQAWSLSAREPTALSPRLQPRVRDGRTELTLPPSSATLVRLLDTGTGR